MFRKRARRLIAREQQGVGVDSLHRLRGRESPCTAACVGRVDEAQCTRVNSMGTCSESVIPVRGSGGRFLLSDNGSMPKRAAEPAGEALEAVLSGSRRISHQGRPARSRTRCIGCPKAGMLVQSARWTRYSTVSSSCSTLRGLHSTVWAGSGGGLGPGTSRRSRSLLFRGSVWALGTVGATVRAPTGIGRSGLGWATGTRRRIFSCSFRN
jgi:hypothetical protein